MSKDNRPDMSLDVATLRDRVARKIIETMRELVKEYEDVEAFERLVVAQRTSGTSSSTPTLTAEVTPTPAKATTARRYQRPRDHYPAKEDVRDAARAILQRFPDGVQSLDLLRRLEANHVIAAELPERSKQAIIYRALADAPGIRKSRNRGRGEQVLYALAAPSRSTTKREKELTPPMRGRAQQLRALKKRVGSNGDAPPLAELRQRIAHLLVARNGKATSPREVASALIADGVPELYHNDRLSNTVGRILREMTDTKLLRRVGQPGPNVKYIALKPTLAVSKESDGVDER